MWLQHVQTASLHPNRSNVHKATVRYHNRFKNDQCRINGLDQKTPLTHSRQLLAYPSLTQTSPTSSRHTMHVHFSATICMVKENSRHTLFVEKLADFDFILCLFGLCRCVCDRQKDDTSLSFCLFNSSIDRLPCFHLWILIIFSGFAQNQEE